MKTIIFVDKRERDKTILNIIKKECQIKEKILNVADFLLAKEMAVERKTISDFLQSIIDGRILRQVKDMKELYKKSMVLVEGDLKNIFELRNIHPNAIRGAIASIVLDYEVPIFWTHNKFQTAEFLVFLAKREQETGTKRRIQIRQKKTRGLNETQEFLVAGLPYVNSVLAKRLLKRFGTPQEIFKASEEELKKVEGIGKKKAKFIKIVLQREYEKSVLEEDED